MKHTTYNIKHKGFTLLETLVALTVLTIGITASLTLIAQSLKSASYFKNQTTSFYLAIEGIEFIKNRRDGNFISVCSQPNPPLNCWLDGLDSGPGNCASANGCYVDVVNNTTNSCSANCPYIKYDQSLNLYNYSSGTDTIFRRKVTISGVSGNNDEREIASEVSWQDRYGSHNFILKGHIFDWFN